MPSSKKTTRAKKIEPKKEVPAPKKETPQPKAAAPEAIEKSQDKFADDIKAMPEKQWGLSPRDLKKKS